MDLFNQHVKDHFPGIGITVITGLAALFLSEHYSAPAMLFALLLGMSISFLYQENSPCAKGIDFASSTVLRAGVVLLGLRVALDDLIALGWQTAVMLGLAIATTILIGVTMAKICGLQKRFGALTGGAVAICGASAALAISTVLPSCKNKERDTLLTVIAVTAMSTIAMVVYPIVVQQLGLSELQAGIFLGGTIHDVAQVVGAGYSVSSATGDVATLTKMVRVAMLVPVVLVIMWIIRLNHRQIEGEVPKFPLFLVGFIALMLINSFVAIPESALSIANDGSRFFLIAAITAIGMKSNLAKFTKVGMLPVVLIVSETIWIALVIFAGILFLL